MEAEWLFMILLPIVAFLYSSVGHGGASGYLALMALFSFPVEVMKPTGLLLNLFVAGIAFYHYWRAGHFKPRLFLFFAGGSVPLAFVGGMIDVGTEIFKIVLGVFLVFSILKMLNVFGKDVSHIRPINWAQGIFVGAVIGFFSGLIGIGGGIILTPVILMMHWWNMKEAAAVSAVFIWVNSFSGLAGQFQSGINLDANIWGYVGLAVIGGFLGAYFGSNKLNKKVLRSLLVGVLTLAIVKLIVM